MPKCPLCKKRERRPGTAFCKPCTDVYRREQRQRQLQEVLESPTKTPPLCPRCQERPRTIYPSGIDAYCKPCRSQVVLASQRRKMANKYVKRCQQCGAPECEYNRQYCKSCLAEQKKHKKQEFADYCRLYPSKTPLCPHCMDNPRHVASTHVTGYCSECWKGVKKENYERGKIRKLRNRLNK